MKNKIYNRIIKLIPLVCLVVLSACKDPMKDYYTDSEFIAPGTESVMEVLKSNPEYSTFVYLLEKTGLDQMFKDNILLTVFVPLNENMPFDVLTLSEEEQVRLVKNHMSLGSVTTQTLEAQLFGSIIALSGRYMRVTSSSKIYYLDQIALLNTDIMCVNGVVQEIAEWILPRVTLYEHLVGLSDDYSIFRDSLLGRTIISFIPDSSSAEYVDEEGKPVWDSVFGFTNNILDKADLDDIKSTFTFFTPTNEAVLNMYQEMTNYLDAVNYPIATEDTAQWMDWLMKVCIVPGMIQYTANRIYYNSTWYSSPTSDSMNLYAFRTNYQTVYNTTPTRCLNGYTYDLDRIRVPKTMYVKEATFNPAHIREDAGGKLDLHPLGYDWWEGQYWDASVSGIVEEKRVFMQYGRANIIADATTEPVLYGFKTIAKIKDEEDPEATYLEEELIMPGYYDVRIWLGNQSSGGLSNQTDSVYVTINGEGFSVAGIRRNRYNKDKPDYAVRSIYIPGRYEAATFEISLYPVQEGSSPSGPVFGEPIIVGPSNYKAWRRFKVGEITLTPTIFSDQNYL